MTETEPQLNIKNPFKDRFGPEYFKRIPDTTGVYWMLSAKRQWLYVRKAKNLRNQIRSFKNLKYFSSKKSILLEQVHDIQWTTCEGLKMAQALELELMKSKTPAFNIIHQQGLPAYIGLSLLNDRLLLKLKPDPSQMPALKSFGAYYNQKLVRESFSSITRVLCAFFNPHQIQLMPPQIVKPLISSEQTIKFRAPLKPPVIQSINHLLVNYFEGHNNEAFEFIRSSLFSPKVSIPPFYLNQLSKDFKSIDIFFKYGPQKNYELRNFLDLNEGLLHHSIWDELHELSIN